MHRDDETPPPRPRWLGWALMVFMALVVLGMLNLGWRMLQPGPGAASAARGASSAGGLEGSAASPPSAPAGLRLVEASDCLRCHGMERYYVGPSFQQIAARYRDRADAVGYLAGKIRNGSVGEWGRTLMPRHPQVTEAQAREMVQWLVSLPVPSAVAQGASAAEPASAAR
jgi:cytochrome c